MTDEPTCQELMDFFRGEYDTADELIARVERVLALHNSSMHGLPATAIPRCADCKQEWPCPTVRILNGKNP